MNCFQIKTNKWTNLGVNLGTNLWTPVNEWFSLHLLFLTFFQIFSPACHKSNFKGIYGLESNKYGSRLSNLWSTQRNSMTFSNMVRKVFSPLILLFPQKVRKLTSKRLIQSKTFKKLLHIYIFYLLNSQLISYMGLQNILGGG